MCVVVVIEGVKNGWRRRRGKAGARRVLGFGTGRIIVEDYMRSLSACADARWSQAWTSRIRGWRLDRSALILTGSCDRTAGENEDTVMAWALVHFYDIPRLSSRHSALRLVFHGTCPIAEYNKLKLLCNMNLGAKVGAAKPHIKRQKSTKIKECII